MEIYSILMGVFLLVATVRYRMILSEKRKIRDFLTMYLEGIMNDEERKKELLSRINNQGCREVSIDMIHSDLMGHVDDIVSFSNVLHYAEHFLETELKLIIK